MRLLRATDMGLGHIAAPSPPKRGPWGPHAPAKSTPANDRVQGGEGWGGSDGIPHGGERVSPRPPSPHFGRTNEPAANPTLEHAARRHSSRRTGGPTNGATESSKGTRPVCRLPSAALALQTSGFEPRRPAAVMQHGEASSARRYTGATGTSMGFLSTTRARVSVR